MGRKRITGIAKICTVCGQEFHRRDDELMHAFRLRKKCQAKCLSINIYSLEVAGIYAHRTEREDWIEPRTLFNSAWRSQNRHWLSKNMS